MDPQKLSNAIKLLNDEEKKKLLNIIKNMKTQKLSNTEMMNKLFNIIKNMKTQKLSNTIKKCVENTKKLKDEKKKIVVLDFRTGKNFLK